MGRLQTWQQEVPSLRLTGVCSTAERACRAGVPRGGTSPVLHHPILSRATTTLVFVTEQPITVQPRASFSALAQLSAVPSLFY